MQTRAIDLRRGTVRGKRSWSGGGHGRPGLHRRPGGSPLFWQAGRIHNPGDLMEEISGLDAVKYSAEDCNIGTITWVPGYPITEIAESLGAKIAVNEKVALEVALGASAMGARSMVIVKQVGMNVLADPLVISATHTIGSGLVILAGDDLGPRGSQAEMDSRAFGPLSLLPVLDPRDPAALYSSILEAFQLSESLRIPCIVRVTKRLISSTGKALLRKPLRPIGQ